MQALGNLLLVPFVVMAAVSGVEASQSSRTYGGAGTDLANSVQATTDGGYIVAGSTSSFDGGGFDGWLLKFDALGNVVWQKTYGDVGGDQAFYDVRQTGDGGYIVAGITRASAGANPDAWVLKLDKVGNITWQKTYGDGGYDTANAVQPLSGGGYIVLGAVDPSANPGRIWLIKLDASGEIVWQERYGAGWDGGSSVQPTADGGFILAGVTAAGINDAPHALFARFDSNGSVVWQKVYQGISAEGIGSFAPTGDGGFIAAGWTASFGAGGSDAWVIKLDAIGNVTWERAYGGTNYDAARSIRPTGDGGYIVAGTTNSYGAGNSDAWLLKLDAVGNIIWQRTYGGTSNDYAYSVILGPGGGYIVAGYTDSFGAGGNDAWVLSVDANGAITGCAMSAPSNTTPISGAVTVHAGNLNGGNSQTMATTATRTISAATIVSTPAIPQQQCYYAAPPAGAVANVPTLSNWLLFLTASLLAICGALILRASTVVRASETRCRW